MKKVYFLLLLTSLGLTNASFSQKFQFTPGKTEIAARELFSVPLKNGKVLMVIRKAADGNEKDAKKFSSYTLLSVDKNSDVRTNDKALLEFDESTKSASILGLFQIKDKPVLFYKEENKERTTTKIMAVEINADDLSFNKPKQFATYSYVEQNYVDATVSYSSDSSTYLLFVGLDPTRSGKVYNFNDTKKFWFAVLDMNLATLFEKKEDLNVENKFIDLGNAYLTADKKVLVTYRRYTKPFLSVKYSKTVSAYDEYVTKMIAYTDNAKARTEISLETEGKFFQNTTITFIPATNKFYMSGTYRNVSEKASLHGVYISELDPSAPKLLNVKYTPFPIEIIKMIAKTDKIADIKEEGLYPRFQPIYQGIRANKSFDILLESRYLEFNNPWGKIVNANRIPDVPTYTRYILLNVNISTEGKATFTRIPKYHVTQYNDYYVTVYPVVANNDLCLLYDEDPDALEKDIDRTAERFYKFEKSVLVMAKINEQGAVTRTQIFGDGSKNDFIPAVGAFTPISPSLILFPQYKTDRWDGYVKLGQMKID